MDLKDKWKIEVKDERLGKKQVITGSDQYVVSRKAKALSKHWDKVYDSYTANEIKLISLRNECNINTNDDNRASSKKWMSKYKIQQLNSILESTLKVDDTIDWNDLIDNKSFSKKIPELQPLRNLSKSVITSEDNSFLSKLFNKEDSLLINHESKLVHLENKRIEAENKLVQERWKNQNDWYLHKQQEYNKKIIDMRGQYFELNSQAVEEYCDMVLNNSDYPTYFPSSWSVNYISQSKSLFVDFKLPGSNDIQISENDLALNKTSYNKLYQDVYIQLCLRTIHELFEADKAAAIDEISFSGFHYEQNNKVCLLTLATEKNSFEAESLEKCEFIIIFKKLKGIISDQLKVGSKGIKSLSYNTNRNNESELLSFNSMNNFDISPEIEVEVLVGKTYSLSLFEVGNSAGKPVLTINAEHPAYNVFSQDLLTNNFVKVLLSSWAHMEGECSIKRREQLKVARTRWGEMLGDIILID